jgi:hypothetical protein
VLNANAKENKNTPAMFSVEKLKMAPVTIKEIMEAVYHLQHITH